MKHIVEIGTYKSGASRLEVVNLPDLEETVNENTAVFVGHTTVTSRIRGQDLNDSYQISQAYLKQQSQWRMVVSQRARVAKSDGRAANDLGKAAA
jgi:hypothetical protein